jgi:hypothetical protein
MTSLYTFLEWRKSRIKAMDNSEFSNNGGHWLNVLLFWGQRIVVLEEMRKLFSIAA